MAAPALEPRADARPSPAPRGAARLVALDALRGVVMALMAIDHASIFVARQHSGEFWGTALPRYGGALAMLTRNVTHLCAPGFFMAMGAGMALFAASRAAAGWSAGRTARFFVTRGLLLVALQLVVENPAWAIGMAAAAPGAGVVLGGGVPGTGDVLLHFGVLYGLGASMIVLGVLMRAPTAAFAALALGAALVTRLLVPGPGHGAGPFSLIEMLLVVPARQGAVQVYYPAIPWLAASASGVVLGRGLLADRQAALRAALPAGVAALAGFVALRLAGAGDFHPVGEGWMGFLAVTKYPPSLAFLLLNGGLDLLLLWALARAPEDRLERAAGPLLAFGRAPLLFYVAHLYLYASVGFAFPRGTSMGAMYAIWILGLVALVPACTRYDRFRRGTPVDSVWRFF